MKNRHSLLLLATVVFFSLQLFSQTTYQKTIGGTGDETNAYCTHTADGNILIAGHTTSGGAGGEDIFVMKTDTMMNIIWSKTYGGAADDFLVDRFPVGQVASPIFGMPDGGFALIGYTSSFGQGSSDYYLLRIDKDGNLLWSKTYGTNQTERGSTLNVFPNGDLLLGGDVLSGPFGSRDVYFVRTDSAGNTIWSKRLGKGSNDQIFNTQLTSDGGFIFAGATQSAGSGAFDTHLFKADANGNMQWSKIYGSSNNDSYNYVQELSGGGYIAAGYTQSFGAGGQDFLLSKVDANGNMLWSKTYGGTSNDIADHIIETHDGGFAFVGPTQSFGAGNFDEMLIKTDGAGNLQWAKVYGGSGIEISRSLDELHGGGYHICGFTQSFGAGGFDVYAIRADANGNSGCNDATITPSVTSPSLVTANFIPSFATGGVQANAATQTGAIVFQQQTLCASAPPPGSNCSNAIALPAHNSTTNQTISGTEQWFSFVADSINVLLTINNIGNQPPQYLNDISVYSNGCGNSVLAGNRVIAGNTNLELLLTQLVVGSSYNIKVKRTMANTPQSFGLTVLNTNNYVPFCGTDAINRRTRYIDPIIAQAQEQFEASIRNYIQNNPSSTGNYIIPVVVHDLTNSIPYKQIQWQIAALNAAFANTHNLYNQQPNGPQPDANIRFCLASTPVGVANWSVANENGVMSYIGITDPLVIDPPSTDDGTGNFAASQTAILNVTHPSTLYFPFDKYLNIWLVRHIDGKPTPGVVGYDAIMPPGTTTCQSPTCFDGIVFRSDVFGDNTIPGNNFNMYKFFEHGTLLAHEVGHYLGLFHTHHPNDPAKSSTNVSCDGALNSDCSTAGDLVCDTPPCLAQNIFCSQTSNQNTCKNDMLAAFGNIDANDLTLDYMSYTYDACLNTFTNGQIARMQGFLNLSNNRLSLWQPANLLATGVSSTNCGTSVLAANFSFSPQKPCPNTPVTFFTPSGPGVSATTWLWNFDNGQGSNIPNPTTTYLTAGTYTVTLTVSNGTTQISATQIITVAFPSAQLTISNAPVCSGSVQPIDITFTGTPPFTVTISDGATLYTLTTSRMAQTLLVDVTTQRPTFTATTIQDGVCTANNGTNAVTFNVIDCCPSILNDGNFEINAGGFTSQMTPHCGSGQVAGSGEMEGGFCIGKFYDPSTNLGWNLAIGLPPRGNSMLANGQNIIQNPNKNNIDLWSQPVNITAATNYHFEFYEALRNSRNDMLPIICRMIIRDATGAPIITSNQFILSQTISDQNLRWRQFVHNFTTPSTAMLGMFTSPFNIAIQQINNFAGGGFDYLIDDISLQAENTFTSLVPSTIATCVGTCVGTATAVPSGGHNQFSYSWSTGATAQTILALCPGNYSVTVTDANKCILSTTATISTFPALSIDITPNNTAICIGSSITLTATPAGGTPPYTYSWSNNITTASQTVTPAVTTTYTVTVTSSGGCASTKTVSVIVNPAPVITITPQNSSRCDNDAGVIVTANTGVGTFSYNWSPAAGLSSTSVANPTATPLATTIYTVVVTNSSTGCVSTKTTTVTFNSSPVVTISPTNPSICAGSNITLTAASTGGLTPYTYTWSNSLTTASQTVTPSANTTYTLTVTGSSGCASTKTVTVGVIPIPSATFTVPTFDNFQNNAVTFNYTKQPGIVYEWTWGDGTHTTVFNATGTGAATITHTYTIPGYFNVTLSAQTDGPFGSTICYDNSSSIIYIIPSVANYNPNPTCVKNFVYTYANLDITAAGTQWNSLPQVNIKGTLTVKAGTNLTINNTTVGFGPEGKVIIEPTGILTLNNSTFTSINFATGGSCTGNNMRMMWQGTEVWGNSGKPSTTAYQGKLVVNNSVIEDAYIAVTIGKKILYPNGIKVSGGSDSNKNGGIIQVSNNSVFNRNSIGIESQGNAVSPFNQSSVSNSFFISKNSVSNKSNTGVGNVPVLDPFFVLKSGTTDDYSDKKLVDHNPLPYIVWHPNELAPALNGAPTHAMYFNGLNGLKLYDNKFEYLICGLYTSFSKFNLEKKNQAGNGNTFDNIIYPIQVFNYTNSFYNHAIIKGNTFASPLGARALIIYHGNIGGEISKNTFGPSQAVPPNTTFIEYKAIDLKISSPSITDNLFNGLVVGVKSLDVDKITGGALIGYSNTGNQFINCLTGIDTRGQSNSLNILCNQFNNPAPGSTLRKVYIQDLLGTQGKLGNTVSAPAGNLLDFQVAINPNRIVNYSTLQNTLKYYSHKDAFCQPNPVSQGGVNLMTVTPNNVTFPSSNPNLACKPITDPVCVTCNSNALVVQHNIITQFQNQYNNMEAILDHGNTALLLTAIGPVGNNFKTAAPVNTTQMSGGQLKDLLIANSPLSDVVILALLNSMNALSPGLFKNVMEINMPVTSNVWPHLNNYIKTLPPGIANQLLDKQLNNPDGKTLAAIQQQINDAIKDKNLYLSNLLNIYLGADTLMINEAVNLLEQENTTEANMTLAGTYIDQGNYSLAQQKLNSLPSTPDYQAYVNLYTLYMNLKLAGRTIFEMDSVEQEQVRTIATMCPLNLAALNAQAALYAINREYFADCPNNLKTAHQTPYAHTYERNGGYYLGNNVPNPFSEKTIIPYLLPDDAVISELIVTDVTGRTIKTYMLQKEMGFIEINMDEFSNGTYMYGLQINGNTMQVKRMVITK